MAEEKKKKRLNFSQAWHDARELVIAHRWRLLLGAGLMLINRPVGLVLPLSSKYLIDDVIIKKQGKWILPLALAAAAATLVQAATTFALSQILGVAAQRVVGFLAAQQARAARACGELLQAHRLLDRGTDHAEA